MEIKKGHVAYERNGILNAVDFDIINKTEIDNITISVEKEKNNGQERLKVFITSNETIQIKDLYLVVPMSVEDTERVYLNGFQTWTDTREFRPHEIISKLSRLIWPITKSYGDYTIYNNTGKKGILHGYTYTYVRRNIDNIEFCGSLTEKNGYTIFEYNTYQKVLYIKKECLGLEVQGEYLALDIMLYNGSENEAFNQYFEVLNLQKPKVKPCTGWTSWYNYYTNINEKIIFDNLKAFKDKNIPIDTFQIDDGYQNAVGDWIQTNNKFPLGMKPIADKIKENGYKAGLWLAPFICEKDSNIYREHNHWILRNSNNKRVKAGYSPLWSGDFYALDFYNIEVREYLKKAFDNVFNNWGFDMVKLDFLYAVAILPREGKTRGQVMCEAMEFLREIIGDKIILGCGVPMGPAFGLVDYCRIGPDVHLKWENDKMKRFNFRERVSTVYSIINAISRRHLNSNTFLNDPDVFILRDENNELTKEEKYTLFLINLIYGGLVFTSDNINNYSQEQMGMYMSQFPHKNKTILKTEEIENTRRILFDIEGKEYLALCNLGANKITVRLDEGLYYNADKGFAEAGTEVVLEEHQSICFIKSKGKDYEIIGSTLHIFPGSEIQEYNVNGNQVNIVIDKNSTKQGEIFIKVPESCEGLMVNGNYIKAEIYKDYRVVRVLK